MKRFAAICLLATAGFGVAPILAHAQELEKQPQSIYAARREALAGKLNGGVAVLYAAPEPLLDFMPYRQDEDFYYLTGWNEPGAALVIYASNPEAKTPYHEEIYFPTRNLRMEKYTGEKLDENSPNAIEKTGIAHVGAMTHLPADLSAIFGRNRTLMNKVWIQPTSDAAKSLLRYEGAVMGQDAGLGDHDVTALVAEERVVKDDGELALIKKAADASMAAQRVMMQSVKPGVTERAVAGKILAELMAQGCERPSYAPIVGSGHNSTELHYAENTATMKDGDVVVVDAAGEFSMYAADITRTVPVNGHFTPRQLEVYNAVLGSQRAAIKAFVAGQSKINDPYIRDANSLDKAAFDYLSTHGKGPHGEPLSKYWIHGLGHMVGINVHDPAGSTGYPAVLRPGMVFTIEPGVYIPEENLGVRIEDTFVVGKDGKLIDLEADLPHEAADVEKAMQK